jgi:hypothetical protein
MNLGQLIGELRMRADEQPAGVPLMPGRFKPYKHGDGRGIGKNQAAILDYLATQTKPQSSSQIYKGLGLTQVDTCIALVAMARRRLVIRHGTRGKYTYTRTTA